MKIKWKLLSIFAIVFFFGAILTNFLISKNINPSDLIDNLPFTNRKIKPVSDNPKYEVKTSNLDIVKNNLNNWGVWKNGITLRNNNLQNRKANPKNVFFHLTDKPQNFDVFGAKKNDGKVEIMSSSGEEIDNNGNINIFIYLSPSYLSTLKENKNTKVNLNKEFSALALRAIFQLTHPNEPFNSPEYKAISETVLSNDIFTINEK